MANLSKNAQIGGKWQTVALTTEETMNELELLRIENMMEIVKCLELAQKIPDISDELKARAAIVLAEKNCISSYTRLNSYLDNKISYMKDESAKKRFDGAKKHEGDVKRELGKPIYMAGGESEVEKAIKAQEEAK
jgi:hypothetical protein